MPPALVGRRPSPSPAALVSCQTQDPLPGAARSQSGKNKTKKELQKNARCVGGTTISPILRLELGRAQDLKRCILLPPPMSAAAAPPASSAPPATGGVSAILPLEMIDKCIGSSIWVVMRTNREFVGTLLGFDDYVSTCLLFSHVHSCPFLFPPVTLSRCPALAL